MKILFRDLSTSLKKHTLMQINDL